MTQMKNDIREMLQEVIREELKPVNEKLEVMENEMQGMRKQFSDKFETLEQKIDGLHEQVAENAENIEIIKDVQERQEKTLDILSRRSIDQEAEIKRIK